MHHFSGENGVNKWLCVFICDVTAMKITVLFIASLVLFVSFSVRPTRSTNTSSVEDEKKKAILYDVEELVNRISPPKASKTMMERQAMRLNQDTKVRPQKTKKTGK